MAGTTSSGGGRRAPISGINVTPMVDVMLVLLVIMMVSAQYIVSQSLKVELPKAASQTESVSSVAAVTLTKDGKTYWNQKPVSDSDLVSNFRSALGANKDLNLIVTADKEVQHGSVVHIIDLAKVEGITKFAINVEIAN
ncbi:MAG: biopolymer transporter ExbD [Pseudomonadota bacterium]